MRVTRATVVYAACNRVRLLQCEMGGNSAGNYEGAIEYNGGKVCLSGEKGRRARTVGGTRGRCPRDGGKRKSVERERKGKGRREEML